jgi:hypothetical protein
MTPRAHRSVGAWLGCALLVGVAVALPTLAIRDAQQNAEVLRQRGVRVTADVLESHGKTCEVLFIDRSSGTPRMEIETLYGGYAPVGRKLDVVYDPRHPATIAYANSIGVVREYLYRAPLVAIALAAAVGAIVVFRRTRPARRQAATA